MDVNNAIEVRGSERKGAVIVSQNNLVISDEHLYGITKSHNMVADLNDFIDAEGRDYGLKPGAAAIDAGIHVEGFTDAVGKPDIGAIEFGAPDWREKVGATIEIPDFPDEEKGWVPTSAGLKRSEISSKMLLTSLKEGIYLMQLNVGGKLFHRKHLLYR